MLTHTYRYLVTNNSWTAWEPIHSRLQILAFHSSSLAPEKKNQGGKLPPLHSRESGRWTPEWVCAVQLCATPLSRSTIRCCKACRQRPFVPHTAPAGLHWICVSSAAVGFAVADLLRKLSPARPTRPAAANPASHAPSAPGPSAETIPMQPGPTKAQNNK